MKRLSTGLNAFPSLPNEVNHDEQKSAAMRPMKPPNKKRMQTRTISKIRLAVLITPALLAGATTVAPAHEQHGGFSAGEPGNPKKPAREIIVEMSEMDYSPSRIEVKRGEQIRFVIRNAGTEDHEFLLATTAENLRHGEMMKKHPHMEHDEPNGVRVAPKKSAEIVWKFSKPGTFDYSCLIPTHREYGMFGKVIVK
jgi:uncharacterized cupredoxin-like copper-binding protein